MCPADTKFRMSIKIHMAVQMKLSKALRMYILFCFSAESISSGLLYYVTLHYSYLSIPYGIRTVQADLQMVVFTLRLLAQPNPTRQQKIPTGAKLRHIFTFLEYSLLVVLYITHPNHLSAHKYQY